jgi:hypothetical protein
MKFLKRTTTARVERGVEVLLGVLVAVAALLPLAFLIGGFIAIIDRTLDWPLWVIICAVTAAALLARWCVITAWRLLMHRERRDGGLLSPTVLILVGIVFLGGAAIALARLGSKGVGGATILSLNALSALSLAYSRFLKRRQ